MLSTRTKPQRYDYLDGTQSTLRALSILFSVGILCAFSLVLMFSFKVQDAAFVSIIGAMILTIPAMLAVQSANRRIINHKIKRHGGMGYYCDQMVTWG